MSSDRFVVFDLDGTLIKENSAWEILHRHFRVDKSLVERNKTLYDKGKIDLDKWIAMDVELWENPHKTTIEEVLRDYTLIDGIKEFIAYLRKRGVYIGIVSSGIDILAECVANELGISECHSNTLSFDEKGLLVGGKGHVDLHRKKDTVQQLATKYKIPLKNFIVVGDTSYDMIDGVGTTIALNPKGELQADYTVDSVRELKEIFEKEIDL